MCVYLQHLCRNFPIVDEHVREAMGDALYTLFMVCSADGPDRSLALPGRYSRHNFRRPYVEFLYVAVKSRGPVHQDERSAS